jgi:hypothetical protein
MCTHRLAISRPQQWFFLQYEHLHARPADFSQPDDSDGSVWNNNRSIAINVVVTGLETIAVISITASNLYLAVVRATLQLDNSIPQNSIETLLPTCSYILEEGFTRRFSICFCRSFCAFRVKVPLFDTDAGIFTIVDLQERFVFNQARRASEGSPRGAISR